MRIDPKKGLIVETQSEFETTQDESDVESFQMKKTEDLPSPSKKPKQTPSKPSREIDFSLYSESTLDSHRIFKIIPPLPIDEHPDGDLIYVLMNPNNYDDKIYVKSSRLADSEKGANMMCKWLERLIPKVY